MGFDSDEEFKTTTGRTLKRLSHLLIELDEKGRTKKEAKLREVNKI